MAGWSKFSQINHFPPFQMYVTTLGPHPNTHDSPLGLLSLVTLLPFISNSLSVETSITCTMCKCLSWLWSDFYLSLWGASHMTRLSSIYPLLNSYLAFPILSMLPQRDYFIFSYSWVHVYVHVYVHVAGDQSWKIHSNEKDPMTSYSAEEAVRSYLQVTVW